MRPCSAYKPVSVTHAILGLWPWSRQLFHIDRKLGVFLRRYPEIKTDVVALIDEWATRFFEELDYVNEGNNATLFAASLCNDLPQARRCW